MGKPFKDKLKNVGDFISGTIAEVEKQANVIGNTCEQCKIFSSNAW